MSSAPRIYCKSCGNCAPVHSLTCPERKPVKRMTEEREDPAEEETTPDEVREAVEMAWTDATHLPPSREQGELCSHLRQATEILDGILESQKKSPEQRLLDRITKDFGIEGDEDAYETAKRLEAAATRLAAEKNDFRKQAEEAADEAAKLGAALAERDDDFRLGMKIANEVTPETQSCEEACADLVRLVMEATGIKGDAILNPLSNPGVSRMCADISLAHEKLGYQSRIFLSQGLRLTLERDPRFHKDLASRAAAQSRPNP